VGLTSSFLEKFAIVLAAWLAGLSELATGLVQILVCLREFFLGEKTEGQFVLVRAMRIEAALELTVSFAPTFGNAV
jgi:hypothetical protein